MAGRRITFWGGGGGGGGGGRGAAEFEGMHIVGAPPARTICLAF